MEDKIKYQLSYLVIPDYIYKDNRLTLIQLKVYGFIHSYTNPFYFGNENLAQMFNCSERSITEALSKLEEYGYIKMTHTPKAGGGTSRLAVDCESDWNSTSSRKLKNEPTTRSVLLHKDIIKDNNLKRENKNYKTKQNSTTKTESFLIDKQAVKESKRSLFGRPRSSTPQKKIEYKKKGGTYAEDVV